MRNAGESPREVETSTRIKEALHNFPALPSSFVGRKGELIALATRLQNPACRLVTILGPGGIGKTRLGIQVAADLGTNFDDGVYFIPLAAVLSVDYLVPAIADVLRFAFWGSGEPRQQLLDYLREQRVMLLIDNFEHLLSGVDLLVDILVTAPEVKMLVTSRERLNIREEWLLDIQGLDYPQDETNGAVEEYSAVQLFLQSARRVKADFQLTQANQSDVVRICRLVDGIPLAIELAASWVRALSCQAIGEEIERNLDFLATSLRDAPEKHRSMRAVFAHSYDLLTAEQQQVFGKLSVFRGGFRREAAQSVAGASLATLAALVDKSLLRVSDEGRYDMHELLRQYGEEQLDASGVADDIHDVHSAYYADFVQQRVDDLKGRRQLEAMAEISADFENVRTAWNRAAAHKREDAIAQMTEGLWVFCGIRNREKEGRALFRYAEQQFAPERGGEPSQLWGRLLGRAAAGETFQTQIESALQVVRRYDDLAEIAFCLHGLGSAAYGERDFGKAVQLLEQSLMIYRQLGDRYATAGVLFDLMSFRHEGNWDDSMRFGEESLRLRREIGDRVGAAWSLSAVAIGEARAGRFAEAERLWLERIALGHETGNRNLVALGNAHLSYQVYFIQGDFAKTRAAAQEALEIATALGDSHATGWALATLGLLASMEEHYHEGNTLCQKAASAQGLAYTADLAAWGSSIASCGLGDYDAANEYLSAALKYMINLRGLTGIIACLPVAAIILAHKSNPVRAVELLALALTHPVRAAGWMEKWPLLARLRVELEQALGSEKYSAAWERGKLLDAEALMLELQEQLQTGRVTLQEKAQQSLIEPLTERELEVLRLIADGLSNQEIADTLILSVGTVKWYTTQIYGKLGVQNRAQAVRRAQQLNFFS